MVKIGENVGSDQMLDCRRRIANIEWLSAGNSRVYIIWASHPRIKNAGKRVLQTRLPAVRVLGSMWRGYASIVSEAVTSITCGCAVLVL